MSVSIVRVLPAFVLLLASCAPTGSPAQNAPAATEIKVGAVLPLTGAFSASGNYFQQAYQLATEEVNSAGGLDVGDRKSTRLNSSHQIISYAVFCLKKKKKTKRKRDV